MRTTASVLRRAGAPPSAAEVQARLLVEAELRGLPSHGVLRLPRIVERIGNGVTDPAATGRHEWVAEAMLNVDGQAGFGPVVALRALDAIRARAGVIGIACAMITNNNHLGMLGWYVSHVAERGQVAIALTTSEALVHPWGGRAAKVGTNPIAIGVPARPEPLVLDMATSAVSMGKIHDHEHRGVALEPGWALDADGVPTTDPAAARHGSLAPFGGLKGYGLGIAFGALVGALTGCALGTDVLGTLDSVHQCTKGDVFIVVQPSAQASVVDTVDAVGAYLDDVRSSPRADPSVAVAVPGDRGRQRRAAATAGGFEVPDDVWAAVTALPGGCDVGPAMSGAPGKSQR